MRRAEDSLTRETGLADCNHEFHLVMVVAWFQVGKAPLPPERARLAEDLVKYTGRMLALSTEAAHLDRVAW